MKIMFEAWGSLSVQKCSQHSQLQWSEHLYSLHAPVVGWETKASNAPED